MVTETSDLLRMGNDIAPAWVRFQRLAAPISDSFRRALRSELVKLSGTAERLVSEFRTTGLQVDVGERSSSLFPTTIVVDLRGAHVISETSSRRRRSGVIFLTLRTIPWEIFISAMSPSFVTLALNVIQGRSLARLK